MKKQKQKPYLPVLLIGVTVNPDKRQGHTATTPLLPCISIVLHRAELPQPGKAKVAHGIAKWVGEGGTSRNAGDNFFY